MEKIKDKIVVILGPTASGKSDVAIKLARKFDGEIISADSRQIYRGMDIGSGKVSKAEQKLAKHWMLDIVIPKTNFSAAQFKKKAEKIIADILSHGKLPIICGGTGFWIKSLVDNAVYPEVKPDWKLRERLNKKSASELFAILKKLDSERAKTIDAKNKVRLIRAIEICQALGKVPALSGLKNNNYNFLQIGISWPKEKLHKRIKIRLDKRFRQGMTEEVRRLHFKNKVSWKKLEIFGLEYRQIALYLQNKISKKEIYPVKSSRSEVAESEFNRMNEKLFQEIKNYAKRQMTWFKKDKRIIWLNDYKEIEKKVNKFLA